MKEVIIFIYSISIIFYSQKIYGQDYKKDSLLRVLLSNPKETDKVDIYQSLTEIYRAFDLDSSYYYSEQFLQTAKTIGDKSKIGTAHAYIANSLRSQAKNDLALNHANKALTIFTELKDTVLLLRAITLKCSILNRLGNNEAALNELKELLNLAKVAGIKNVEANAYNELGNVYSNLGDFKTSMNSYLAALNLYESLDEKINIGKTLNNLGTLSFSIKDYKKSEEYFLKAIEFHRANGNYTNLANTYTNLASMNSIKENKNATAEKLNRYSDSALYYSTIIKSDYLIGLLNGVKGNYFSNIGEHEKAFGYYKTSLEIALKLNDSLSFSNAYLNMGNNLSRRKKFEEADTYYRNSLNIAEKLSNSDQLSKLYRNIAEHNYLYGNYALASQYYRNYSMFQDSLYGVQVLKVTKDLETKYETEKMQATITNQSLELKNKNLFLGILSSLLLGTFGIGFYFYSAKKKEAEINRYLDFQNEQLKLSNQGLFIQLSDIKSKEQQKTEEEMEIAINNGVNSKVKLKDIVFIEAENNLLNIYISDGTVKHDYQRLKNFCDLFKNSTLLRQVHRSYIVNALHVSELKANDIKLSNKKIVPIGITYKTETHEWLNKYMS